MQRPRDICIALLAVLVLSSALSACAAYQKCGLCGCPGDATITAGVQAAFEKHPELEPPNLLNVQTIDRVVYLYGLVDTDYQRQMAETVARQALGVTKVINSIGLSGNAR
jgi:osmotically-inducible protein OsmY